MKSILTLIICLTLLSCSSQKELNITPLSGFPTEKGYSKGLSAQFSGVITGGKLVLIGGNNFPGVPAAKGGKKAFYSSIYSAPLTGDSLVWNYEGQLPIGVAYGATIQPDSSTIILIGGSSSRGDLHESLKIDFSGDSLNMSLLPPFNEPISNTSASLVGNTIYVVGGAVNGTPTNRMLSLDLSNPDAMWQEETPMPDEPRVQCIAVTLNHEGEDKLFVFGGFATSPMMVRPTVSLTTLCYSPSTKKWSYVAPPTNKKGEPLALGGAAGVRISDTQAIFTGGVNKDIFLEAISNEHALYVASQTRNTELVQELKDKNKDYLLHDANWYNFGKEIMLYDATTNKWTQLGESPLTARAGAAMVNHQDNIYVINGEIKPGVRTPKITRISNFN